MWITEKPTLFKDAQRDLTDVGWLEGAEKLFSLSKINVGRHVKVPEGIMFATYALLAREFKHIKPDVPETLEDMAVRLNQITGWLGKDFDGAIVFDECHNMANAQGKETDFGKSAASQKAMAGVLLQNLLPNARVLYVSATAATEISNFAYLERLGLWGEGTAFKSKNDFISKIGAGGMAWCFDDEANTYTDAVQDRLIEHKAHVPAIWPLEVANVLLVAERKNRISTADSGHFIALLSQMPIEVEQNEIKRVFHDTMPLAREHRLTSYDASYLELAIRKGLPIASLDKAIRRAAENIRLEIIDQD